MPHTVRVAAVLQSNWEQVGLPAEPNHEMKTKLTFLVPRDKQGLRASSLGKVTGWARLTVLGQGTICKQNRISVTITGHAPLMYTAPRQLV